MMKYLNKKIKIRLQGILDTALINAVSKTYDLTADADAEDTGNKTKIQYQTLNLLHHIYKDKVNNIIDDYIVFNLYQLLALILIIIIIYELIRNYL